MKRAYKYDHKKKQLSVIENGKIIDTINIGALPINVCYSPKQDMVYVYNDKKDVLQVIDCKINLIIETIVLTNKQK